MALALGKFLLFREASRGSVVAIVAVVAIVLVLFLWPRLIAWLDARRR